MIGKNTTKVTRRREAQKNEPMEEDKAATGKRKSEHTEGINLGTLASDNKKAKPIIPLSTRLIEAKPTTPIDAIHYQIYQIRKALGLLRTIHILINEFIDPNNKLKQLTTQNICTNFLRDNHYDLWSQLKEKTEDPISSPLLKAVINALYAHENRKMEKLIKLYEAHGSTVFLEEAVNDILNAKPRINVDSILTRVEQKGRASLRIVDSQ